MTKNTILDHYTRTEISSDLVSKFKQLSHATEQVFRVKRHVILIYNDWKIWTGIPRDQSCSKGNVQIPFVIVVEDVNSLSLSLSLSLSFFFFFFFFFFFYARFRRQ